MKKNIWPGLAVLVLAAMPLALPAQDGAAAPPLPPLETVLRRVAEQAKRETDNDRTFDQRYSYTRTRVTEYRNGKGALKKREEKKRVNDPATAPTPPPPSAAKDPDSNQDPAPDGAVTDTHSNVRGKAFQKKDFLLDEDLLRRFEFTLAGREVVNGRAALVVDFKPNGKKSPERNLKDRFINKAAGRVWVDEAEDTAVKADLYLTEKVNVVGGLVGAVWKFVYTFERERTTDGLWFTRRVDWHLEGREVFLRRTVDYHEEKTGAQKAR